MKSLNYYTTKHREHETSVYHDNEVAILTIGAAGCAANIHLNAADCRAVAAMLLNAAAVMGVKEPQPAVGDTA